ncbi:MAG: hypothetical protein OXG15_05010, partial [Gammaproteobacteria bacterium]|nr:hypothetical protein [Gammaproteobacteria bacterium]
GRMKAFASATELASNDILAPSVSDPMTDFRLDLRLMFKRTNGPVRIEFDPTLTWTGGDAVQVLSASSLPLDQLPGNDSRRYFNWSDEVFGDDEHRLVARVDRLSIAYRQPSWSVQVGRQAVSWGNGLVFQPLDLFSPFAPTTIDREFKPGVDSVLFETLVGNSNELQMLMIGRKHDVALESPHTMALKWHTEFSGFSLDLIFAEHIGDDFAAFSLSLPIAGSLLRLETSRLCSESTCTMSGLANMDYTLSVGPALLYLFGEFYHNGFGLDQATDSVPDTLNERFARGEIFTLMKNYGSLGLNITWHPLWSQSFIYIENLEDNSGLIQTSVNYEPGDASRVQFGVSAPFGDNNTEFGTREFGDDFTSGGGATWFLSIAYYF